MLRMVTVHVCTRRLRTLRTVKKFFAKIEKIANMITKTPSVKSLFSDSPRGLRFSSCAGLSASEPGISFFMVFLNSIISSSQR